MGVWLATHPLKVVTLWPFAGVGLDLGDDPHNRIGSCHVFSDFPKDFPVSTGIVRYHRFF